MGLFSKQPNQPVVHPAVERVVYVHSSHEAVRRHLDEYSSLFPVKHSVEETLLMSTVGDWTAIRLPDAVHPWQLHNLAFWMLDCDGADNDVIAQSAAAPNHAAYRLVRDPELPDALCGWDDEGEGWTVLVPTNDIVYPEDVPVPQAVTMPSGFNDWSEVTVRLEDPGAFMNADNDATAKSRERLADHFDVFTWAP